MLYLCFGSVLDENVVGSGWIGGSPHLVVLYEITVCISDALSLSNCDTNLASSIHGYIIQASLNFLQLTIKTHGSESRGQSDHQKQNV